MKNIRFGIIGCGDVTEVKSGPAFNKCAGSELTMVMRRDPIKVADYAKRHGVSLHTTDYTQVINSDQVDAIYIATPPKYHHFYTLEAAKAGKAVYVEKPMAMTVVECEEMIKACRQAGVPLYVAYYRRGQGKFKEAKSLIESGRIGTIRSFHYAYTQETPKVDPNRAWLMDKDFAGGGLLYDIGSHMIDSILYLLGDLQKVIGQSVNQSGTYKVMDMTSGYMVFESGVQGSLQLTFNGAYREDCLTVIGSEGSIKLGIMNNDPISLFRDQKEEKISFAPMDHVQEGFIQMMVNSLHGLEVLDQTGKNGLITQKVLEALQGGQVLIL